MRSSYCLEETVTEFDIQGLELDYTIVAWDADFRFDGTTWRYHKLLGNRWTNIMSQERKMYLKNAYRVLLTRARQGMVIFVPNGCEADMTRQRAYYDETYKYLVSLGIKALPSE